jgi:16S rRNA (adenine1518-N6/adenine1519-N6)-dimethyltransferase
MVQREVADRIASPAGRKSYGSLSVLCQTYARVEPILTLGPGSFRPRPKVDSAVIRLTLCDPGGVAGRSPDAFAALLRSAFEQRRKTLLNNLARLRPSGAPLGRQEAERLIRAAGLDPRRRAEDIPVEGFHALAGAIAAGARPGRYNARGDHAPPH